MEKIKYKQIANTLRERIKQGICQPGQRMDTEQAMMDEFQVSRQTVRLAISMLVSEGLVYRMQGSGTYVSYAEPPMSSGRRNITFVSTYISEHVFPSIIRGAEEVISRSGYALNLVATGNQVAAERELLTELLDNPPAGMIVEGTKTGFSNPNINLYRQLVERRVKIVFINGWYKELERSVYVITNDRAGGEEAARFLIGKGHSRIGCIFKADDMQGQERYSGFVHAMADNRLPVDDTSVVWFTTEDRTALLAGQWNERLLKRFASCTAVVCYNDQIARMLVDTLLRSGIRVPQDKAVISFDGTAYSDMGGVRITTLRHPLEKLGREAAEKLVRMLDGVNERPLVMPWVLEEKEST